MNFKGICPACGWSAAAKKPVGKPVSVAAKPGAPKAPVTPTKQLAPPEKPAAPRSKVTDDDELMEMALSSMQKPGAAKPPVKKPAVKRGEDEFFRDE